MCKLGMEYVVYGVKLCERGSGRPQKNVAIGFDMLILHYRLSVVVNGLSIELAVLNKTLRVQEALPLV